MSTSRPQDNVVVFGEENPEEAADRKEQEKMSERLFALKVPEIEQVPVLFTWTLPSGNEPVYISGTFNQWSERIPLQPVRTPDPNDPSKTIVTWQVVLLLYPQLYALRFIVEGKWRVNPRLPIRSDDQNNEFNAILVKAQPPPPTQEGFSLFSSILTLAILIFSLSLFSRD